MSGHYWQRSDGKPWESLESLPPAFDEVPDTPAHDKRRDHRDQPNEKTDQEELGEDDREEEGTDYEDASSKNEDQEDTEDEDSQYDDAWEDVPTATPSQPTFDISALKNLPPGLIIPLYDTGRRELPLHLRPRPYPHPHPAQPIYQLRPGRYPYPGPGIYPIGPRPGPHGHSHPALIPLSQLSHRHGIYPPIQPTRRGLRPLSPLSPPPTKPKREDFEVKSVEYVFTDGKLYSEEKEIVFPKPPKYLPPVVKKAPLPSKGRSGEKTAGGGGEYDRRRGLMPADLPDDWMERTRRGGGQRYPLPQPRDGEGKVARGTTVTTVREERLLVLQERRKKHKKKSSGHDEKHRSGKTKTQENGEAWVEYCRDRARRRGLNPPPGRYYHAGRKTKVDDGDSDGEGEKASSLHQSAATLDAEEPEIRHGKDRSHVKFADHDTDISSGPDHDVTHHSEEEGSDWSDVDDHIDHDFSRQRGRSRRSVVDGKDVDVYQSSRHAPGEPRPYNIKKTRDKALKMFGKSTKKDTKGKGKAKAEDVEADADDEPDIEATLEVSESEIEKKPKKPDPHAAFKKTTGRHPKHFHINRKGEAYERFVVDRRPLAEGEDEPTGKHKRRPMIDVVDLKTGVRTRKEIKGYDKVPKLIRIAAGVEGVNGRLPPRRDREGEERRKVRGKKKGRGKGDDRCCHM